MKIAHITDDNIFLENALFQFEDCFPNKNNVFVLSNKKTLTKIKNNKNITIVSSLEKINIQKFDYIIFHSLNIENARYLNKCKITNQKLIWLLHGYEVYSLHDFKPKEIYDRITLKQFKLTPQLNIKINNIIRPFLEVFINSDTKEIKKAMKKVDFLGVPYKEEYDFLCKKFKITSKWLKFSYYPLDEIIKNNTLVSNANNIFIGNSATCSSNHLDVFDKLKDLKLDENQKIICPLSYGDKNYAKEIIKVGEKMFGDNFMPLTDFIPLTKYKELLSLCSITIMNHKRQQAFGTILSMIYMGSNVFLNPKSTIFHFCKNNNIVFSTLQSKNNIFRSLNDNEIRQNRLRINTLFNQIDLNDQIKSTLKA